MASSSSNQPAGGIAPAVAIEQAARNYGSLVALAPVSLTVRVGETVALLGPSGSGKTTLLMLVAGEVKPTSGRVLVGGRDLSGLQPGLELARLAGMIHQQFDLVHNLSSLQNVLAGRLGRWGLLKSLASLVAPLERPAAMAAMERVGVADRAGARAGTLSGGEQQRVAIARLLLQDPLVVLADEPVASLDPARAEEVLRLLVCVTADAGKTLIASMHSIDLARAHFGRLVGLRNGRVVFDLPAGDVSARLLEDLYSLKGLRGAA